MLYFTSQQTLIITIIAWTVGVVLGEQTCYFPSGAEHSLGLPCNPDTKAASACCESTHVCLSNALCLDTLFNHVVRGSCTDATYKDGACPQYCLKGSESAQLADLRQCNGQNDNWVCSMNVTDCEDSFTISALGQVDDRRNSSVNNVLHPASSTTTDTSSTSTAAAIARQDGDGNSETLKVALGVGLGVGLPLLAVLIISLWFLRKTRQELVEAKSAGLLASHPGSDYQQEGTGQGQQTYLLKSHVASPDVAPDFPQQPFQPQVSVFAHEMGDNSQLAEFPAAHSKRGF